MTTKDELNERALSEISPRYVFFPHWSWFVPPAILNRWECVCFHMTDVPFGRGGSPLQNLIGRGIRETKLTALQMSETIDGGPVYLKRALNLDGSAQQIFERAADLVYDSVAQIVAEEPKATPQDGEVVMFSRRTPAQSVLPSTATVESVFDHIRMLDADTYPRAFLDHGDLRLEFSDAKRDNNEVVARVTFKLRDGGAT
jgi:methionyl-tRNA formyltransferase